ncbi:type I-D CRISPR-associated protein Cas7/Csc2 [Acidianus sulfidivorans JP7]|uniref:Type I-D CRISPR-associated protein Cas7/Csc2 n=1 Tax=Acidianus sulfidivorans JP7 TaxID=619593 RepID=A0A2U9IQ36_9CREN|nr:type I-D CRISPR-associated protein Cas7/Csc2 [Acidianus sulfidivorans]AWR98125.1 type I-D CRISPR-associated protein Cas7/Csc2 [Acidianus sulfidivorans JP7]
MSNTQDIFKSIFGIEYDKVKQFFSDLSSPNKVNAVPQGRVINVYVLLRANNELLIRHEGREDIPLATIEGEKYPIILYEKIQSAFRRKELELLRNHYSQHKKEVDAIRGKNDDWFCALRPTASTKNPQEEKVGGQCRECPDCMTFGFAVAKRSEGQLEYNVKSRIEGDLFIATTPLSKSVIIRTFNAVDDITKTTIIGGKEEEEGRTGALFRYSLVREVTIFVGKIVMKDIGINDFLLKLATLSVVQKIGGRTTHFGNVEVIIPAILFSTYEVSSSYDLFTAIKGMENLKGIVDKIHSHLNEVKKGVLVTSDDFAKIIRQQLFDDNGSVSDEIVKGAWTEAKNFKASIEEFIKQNQKQDQGK